MENEIILQTFNNNSYKNKNLFKNILKNITKIKELGITKILVPPLSESYDDYGYFPNNYYNFNSNYGNKEDIISLSQKIDLISEVSIWKKFKNLKRKNYNFDNTILNTTNEIIIYKELLKYIRFLNNEFNIKNIKISNLSDNFSNNFIKYLSNNEPKINIICDKLIDMSYINFIPDYNQHKHRMDLSKSIDLDTNFYSIDFTTKGLLNYVFESKEWWRLSDDNSNPSGLIGFKKYYKNSFTFVDNHETIQNWKLSNDYILEAYIYIVFHPGIPIIFIDHYNDYYDDLKYLLTIKKFYKINNFDCGTICQSNVYGYTYIIKNIAICFGKTKIKGEKIFQYNLVKIIEIKR